MHFEDLTPAYDAALAKLIRESLKKRGLDIPGTAYFDETLDHLSVFYSEKPDERCYSVLLDDEGTLLGGVGLAAFEPLEGCAELQKLYLAEHMHGMGLGYEMIRHIEERAAKLGYSRMYLETHTNLGAAIHIYERSGYNEIERPAAVVHTTMNRFYLKERRNDG